MPRYTVNATLTVLAWMDVEAETPDAALAAAREYEGRDFDYDLGSAEVDFNVMPTVEPA